MKSFVIGVAALAVSSSLALAQTAQPSYQADPETYKLIHEDQNFRVIATTWKAGKTDKPHTHPVPSVAYHLTDCTLIIRNADGTTRETTHKAGASITVAIAARPHRAENPGATDCHSIIVERK